MQAILEMLGSVGFNWHVALANFVNFLIILFLLNRFVFTRIGKVIDDRDQHIKQGLLDAQEAGRAKAEAHTHKEEIIRHAETEAHTIVNDAHKKAELLAVEVKDKAVHEAQAVLAEAATKKDHAKKEAEKEFAALAPKLVADLTRKALRETMTKESNDALIASLTK